MSDDERVWAMSPMTFATSGLSSTLRCCVYSLGIIIILAMYGLLQERIMSSQYDLELFTMALFLVFCNRLCAAIFAAVMIRNDFQRKVPLWKYLVIAVSNVASTTCQYQSLRFVSFTVLLLGKNFKLLPSMLFAKATSRRSYQSTDWAVATCANLGVLQFLVTGPFGSVNRGYCGLGLFLISLFLVLDGARSTLQEKLLAQHHASKYSNMLAVNLSSTAVAFCCLSALGEIPDIFSFCRRHYELPLDAALLGLAAAGAQACILSKLAEFGTSSLSATMNLRQVVSITLSYMVFGHSITTHQLMGLMMVFAPLFMKTVWSLRVGDDEKKTLLSKDEAGMP
mmetsp:Transcript_42973/g.93563  ORF Transcript_42973/g.93563 Transcript_42973/m.93563 type:complete len:339 (-) Transcript_42973:116-1132(-)